MFVLGGYRGIRQDSREELVVEEGTGWGKHKGFIAARPGKWKEHGQEQARGAWCDKPRPIPAGRDGIFKPYGQASVPGTRASNSHGKGFVRPSP